MELIFKKRFKKNYRILSPSIQSKVREVLDIFMDNPLDMRLNNHALLGNLEGTRSINITGDYRIHFVLVDDRTYEIVSIENIGTHSHLYG